MIKELQDLIDISENEPKAKKILLKVAELKEEDQKPMLDLIKLIIRIKK